MQRFECLVVSMLSSMKKAFEDEKESFKFYKFHTIVHAPYQIKEFGNLRIMDGNRFVTLFM